LRCYRGAANCGVIGLRYGIQPNLAFFIFFFVAASVRYGRMTERSSITTVTEWTSTVVDVDVLTQFQNTTTTSSLESAPQYYDPLYKIIGFVFVSVIFVVGLVGNLMVILVVWRTRSMRTPTNCYLVSLAVADILLLVSAPLPTLIELFLIMDQSIFGAVGCAAMVRGQIYYC